MIATLAERDERRDLLRRRFRQQQRTGHRCPGVATMGTGPMRRDQVFVAPVT
jgi:hypothetical protein